MNQKHSIGIILAAGFSERFGSLKQLYLWQNKSLLEYTYETLKKTSIQEIFIICNKDIIEKISFVPETQLIIHPKNEGLSSSLRESFLFAIKKKAKFCLITTCDQPFITNQHYDLLIQYSTDQMISVSNYGDSIGIPCMFPRKFFKKFLTFDDKEKGAKKKLFRYSNKILSVPLSINEQQDIDTLYDAKTYLG
jgi:molybdenum cofactor cytidylyltransferase